MGKVYKAVRKLRLSVNLTLAKKPAEVVKFKEADDTHIAGKVWAHVENSREGDADLESIYEAGLPALTKTIAAKNSNYFSHGKKSEAILAMDARKAELAQAEAI
jgi:hypothetical protein